MAKTMTVRLDDDRAAQLEMVARADGQTLTDAMRAALDAHIETRRRDENFMSRLRELRRSEDALFKRLAG